MRWYATCKNPLPRSWREDALGSEFGTYDEYEL